MLSVLRAELGSLNRVRRVVKVLGFVNCVDDFGEQPFVINGTSELLKAVFGDKLGMFFVLWCLLRFLSLSLSFHVLFFDLRKVLVQEPQLVQIPFPNL